MWWILGILISIYVLSAVIVFIQISVLPTKKVKAMVCLTALTPILNSMFVLSIMKVYYEVLMTIDDDEI
jgi:hypothetical protein